MIGLLQQITEYLLVHLITLVLRKLGPIDSAVDFPFQWSYYALKSIFLNIRQEELYTKKN